MDKIINCKFKFKIINKKTKEEKIRRCDEVVRLVRGLGGYLVGECVKGHRNAEKES